MNNVFVTAHFALHCVMLCVSSEVYSETRLCEMCLRKARRDVYVDERNRQWPSHFIYLVCILSERGRRPPLLHNVWTRMHMQSIILLYLCVPFTQRRNEAGFVFITTISILRCLVGSVGNCERIEKRLLLLPTKCHGDE